MIGAMQHQKPSRRPPSAALLRNYAAPLWLFVPVLVSAVAIVLAVVIWLLLVERRRLRRNALVSQRLAAELGRIMRSIALAEITAAVSNRIAQPLTATLINAETAVTLLSSPRPSIEALRELLIDLRADCERTATALDRFRDDPSEHSVEMEPVEIDVIIGKALTPIRATAQRHAIEVRTEIAPRLVPMLGNPLHVQALVSSLSLNAIEAMKGAVDGPRVLTIVADSADQRARVVVRHGIAGAPTGHPMPRLIRHLYSLATRAGLWGRPTARAATAAFGGTLWVECTLTDTAVGFDAPTTGDRPHPGTSPSAR